MEWARYTFDGGFYAQTCFIAQQAAEKLMKAYCFLRGFDVVKTHSIYQMAESLGEEESLKKNARILDLYYISSRYPDAFPAGAPFEMIDREQAARALEAMEAIHFVVAGRLKGE